MTTVLASASPARLAVLRAAGIDPVVRVSGVDEKAIEAAHAGGDPADTVAALARAKAEAVLPQLADDVREAVVIGCDSMLLMNGTLRGKPANEADARLQWAEMAGGTGDLLTGHAVVRVSGGERVATAVGTERTVIRFGRPEPHEIDAYLATGEPLHVAGSLTIDGYGGWFVDGVDGDPSSVIGISLPLTRSLLAGIGVGVTDLWRAL
ncbi:septum formation inhibitor Maf [Nakamurella sp. YIM 132087]|uniref:Nucleoside triphosphate pyrophosphatase n=1 Tax=Nakamurella alba TaxID=2665158 RepID=A0A7K1FJC5_9ACTN|nr:septum formation inhibitor Maf [Nakamurella alba]